MKVYIIIIWLFSISFQLSAQNYDNYLITFEGQWDTMRVDIDSLSNENNSWQIGPPQKDWLSEARSSPNVIITDTLVSYPPNDSSIFYIIHLPQEGFGF